MTKPPNPASRGCRHFVGPDCKRGGAQVREQYPLRRSGADGTGSPARSLEHSMRGKGTLVTCAGAYKINEERQKETEKEEGSYFSAGECLGGSPATLLERVIWGTERDLSRQKTGVTGGRLYCREGRGIVGGWIAFEMPAGIGWLSFPRLGPRPEGQYRVFAFAPHLVWIKGPYGLCPPRGTYTKFPPPISPGLEGGSHIQRSWKANAPRIPRR